MQENSLNDEELVDSSPTDELPVLTEHNVVNDEESTRLFAALVEDTGIHESPAVQPEGGHALEAIPAAGAPDRAGPGHAAPGHAGPGHAGPGQPVPDGSPPGGAAAVAHERRLAEQARLLAERAATIASLEERLAATREAVRRREEAEQALRAALAEQERQQEVLSAALEQAQARVAELEHGAAERARELESAQAEIASKARAEQDLLDWLVGEEQARASLGRELAESQREAEELAAALAAAAHRGDELAAGIEAVRSDLAALTERAEAAEREAEAAQQAGDALAHARAEAAALAAYIDNRRVRWEAQRAELAEREATIEELRREIEQRARRRQETEAAGAAERRRNETLGRERDALRLELDARRRAAPPEPPPELQREIERLRREVSALHEREVAQQSERDGRAAEAAELQRRADEASAQLAQARVSIAHLERTLLERDRVIDAQNHRIEALQAQAGARSGRFQSLDSGPREAPAAARQPRTTPVLVCLTGEAPRSYRLGKPAMKIGRSAHCDIQIVTQFVSREHARLEIAPDGVAIEDLGSKNGVFVNSVRVERETLRHGDIVTVGETQFRFLGQ